jgi:hypothetical protein
MSNLKTTISGNILIGPPAKPLLIPIESVLPPTKPGNLQFKFNLPKGTPPTAFISVGDLLTWAKTNLSSPVTAASLPPSLTKLSVAVSSILVDTSGKFDLGMLFGSQVKGKWDPKWTPIPGLPFTLSDVEIKFDYEKSEK